jgi:predicted membrane GTPase involved in stress response
LSLKTITQPDELVEVTLESTRMRKRVLAANMRPKAKKAAE